MKYVAAVMFIWFLGVTLLTMYGMFRANKATKFDTLIGLVIGPLLTFVAAFILVWSSTA